MSSCKEQSPQPITERPQVKGRFWLAQIFGWRPLCHQWNLEAQKNFISEPTNQALAAKRGHLSEITLMNSQSPSLQTQRQFWHDPLPIPILLWKIKKKRNFRIIFMSFCWALPPLQIETLFSMCALFFVYRSFAISHWEYFITGGEPAR